MTLYEALGWLTVHDWWILSFVAGFMLCVGGLFVGGLVWVRTLLSELDAMTAAQVRRRVIGRTSSRG